MSEAIKEFIQWRSIRYRVTTINGDQKELRRFCLFLHDKMVSDIMFDDVLEYIKILQRFDYDMNTIHSACRAMRKFVEFCNMRKLLSIDPNLIPLPQPEFKIPRVCEKEDFEQLLAAIPVKTNDPRHIRNRAIVLLLWDTGVRNGEVVSLNLSQLDLENRKALIQTEKSKTRRPIREIFWSEETNEALIRWLKKRDDLSKKMMIHDKDAVFISITHKNAGQRFGTRGVQMLLIRYSDLAGLPRVNPHAFRHGKAHRILWDGGSAADVQNILGHASLASSTTYTFMWGNELQSRAKTFLQKDALQRQRRSPFSARRRRPLKNGCEYRSNHK